MVDRYLGVGGVVFIGRVGCVCCNTCYGASQCCVFEVTGVVLGQARGVVLAGFWTGVCAIVSSHLT